MDSCCENVSFTVENPVVLLNGSVEVVGGYIYHTEGSSCDVMDVRANVSIREGMPIGAVACEWICSVMNASCTFKCIELCKLHSSTVCALRYVRTYMQHASGMCLSCASDQCITCYVA